MRLLNFLTHTHASRTFAMTAFHVLIVHAGADGMRIEWRIAYSERERAIKWVCKRTKRETLLYFVKFYNRLHSDSGFVRIAAGCWTSALMAQRRLIIHCYLSLRVFSTNNFTRKSTHMNTLAVKGRILFHSCPISHARATRRRRKIIRKLI